jgi:hypothetical protein
MTSVFEVLSNKETQAENDIVKATDKYQSAIQTNKESELTSRKYFMICQTCFWCASYIDIMGNIDALTYNVCPTCNHTTIELLPLSNDEHYRFENSATRGIILELGENPSGNYKSIFKASHFSHLL